MRNSTVKYTVATLIFIFSLSIGTACHYESNNSNRVTNDPIKTMIIIKVGDKKFTATLSDNASATEFKSLLPLTIYMTELNGNEKYFRLPKNLPTNESSPGTINAGDLMLWGSNTLVLFYKNFSTQYSYTKLGKIDNPSGLAKALGASNVMVTFEPE